MWLGWIMKHCHCSKFVQNERPWVLLMLSMYADVGFVNDCWVFFFHVTGRIQRVIGHSRNLAKKP